jgi:hypothetical protein
MQCFNEVVPELLHTLDLASSKGESVNNSQLMSLTSLKKSLTLFSDSASTVRNTLSELIRSDNDMLHLLLTARRKYGGSLPPADYHDDVELLLEHHYRGMSSVTSEVERMLHAMDSTLQSMQVRCANHVFFYFYFKTMITQFITFFNSKYFSFASTPSATASCGSSSTSPPPPSHAPSPPPSLESLA